MCILKMESLLLCSLISTFLMMYVSLMPQGSMSCQAALIPIHTWRWNSWVQRRLMTSSVVRLLHYQGGLQCTLILYYRLMGVYLLVLKPIHVKLKSLVWIMVSIWQSQNGMMMLLEIWISWLRREVHAENGDGVAEGQRRMIELGIMGPEGHALSRPPLLEGEATARAIRLAAFVNTPLYVVHVMSIDALEEIAQARKSGQRVIGEPVVSGLVLDESKLWDPDFITAAKYVMSPPIRKSGHDKALQGALSSGILQLVGTDHCTFNSAQKAMGIHDFRKIPNGVNGIEERMHLVWDLMVETGQISASDFVRITSTACAQIFNIYPRKGAILTGSDADIIILNPNSSFQINAESHHSRTDTNVYEGKRGKGKIEVTISRGRIVWENGELKVEPGTGRYVPMPPFSYLFDGIDKMDSAYYSSLHAPVQRMIKTVES
ncbi:dihydropyrimidinase isoform X3 [Amborella trichopoda]|uniref:dihydropyrimidinase isoform X3 n=1 Tax=Amborella trichopoda TaxID=13333 RepID=UPI0009BE2A08|nr:dihydropyrimidinase isoform X3 [Amborella trichopoda]|eukprot:XP_020518041.1 dihydropyrimidinase isoform X3 [Amborella trichopoda]